MEVVTRDGRVAVDFDHHSTEYAEHHLEILRELRERTPVAWSEHHEGFWVVSRFRDISHVLMDDETFASYYETGPGEWLGTNIPQTAGGVRGVPNEMQPPESIRYRRLMNPLFTAAAVQQWEPFVRDCTTACIDQVIETGQLEFIRALANPVPALLTLEFLGIPLEHWQRCAAIIHGFLGEKPGTEGFEEAQLGAIWLLQTIMEQMDDRRVNPKDDLISRLTHADIDGAPLPEENIISAVFFAIGGGVDTTTSSIGHALHWLGNHDEDRRRLIEDPSLIIPACEEFLRLFPPVQGMARIATRDVEVGGQLIRPGERLLLMWASANRDEAVFERSDEFIIDRSHNRHMTFAAGSHRCVGAGLARMDFRIMLEEILQRMPDFEPDYSDTAKYPSMGLINAYTRLPARFTPGPRMGTSSSRRFETFL